MMVYTCYDMDESCKQYTNWNKSNVGFSMIVIIRNMKNRD